MQEEDKILNYREGYCFPGQQQTHVHAIPPAEWYVVFHDFALSSTGSPPETQYAVANE